MLKDDEITIEILPDGTIKSEIVGSVSPTNHSSAEQFLRMLDELTGTKGVRSKRKGAHIHIHDHKHDHEKAGQ